MSSRERQQATPPWGPSDPQALNRYSYVNNNPLRYTDPSGHKWKTIFEGNIPIWEAFALQAAVRKASHELTALISQLNDAITALIELGDDTLAQLIMGSLGAAIGGVAGLACGKAAPACVGFFAYLFGELGSKLGAILADTSDEVTKLTAIRDLLSGAQRYLTRVDAALGDAIHDARTAGEDTVFIGIYINISYGIKNNIKVVAGTHIVQLFK